MKKHFTAHIIFAATAMASQQVWALGFGRAVSDAVLGQALTFTVPINVEPGERFGLDCVSTQVFYGEVQLLPNALRADLQRGATDNTWLLKITTTTPVEEPIIEVAVSAGCERRFTRRFSVFADPPTLVTGVAQTAPVAASSDLPAAARAAATALPPIPATSGDAQVDAPRLPRLAHHHAGAASATAGARARVVRAGPTMALANELNAPAPGAHGDAGSAHRPAARTATPAPAETPRLVLDAGMAHLKLDMEDPIIPPPSASAAAIGLSDLDDPEARQLKSLEQSIQAIRHDKQVQLEQAAKLQAELADAQSRSDWLPWLFGLLLLALAAIVALWVKLRRQTRIAHSDWFNQSQLSALPAPGPPPAAVPEPAVAVVPAPDLRSRKAGVPAPAVEVDAHQAPSQFDEDAAGDGASAAAELSTTTRPLDRQAMAAAMSQQGSPRELSVEELLDLEQQADFFIALGQEDAAVDLLMSHLRSAGGQSPLPYTKLLEIYRRQGDRSAYERTRARFNRRFNAYAPDWDTGPAAGRSLEDYPDTIALLEGAWSSPIDAMAILEGLLFKRDDTSELFDLPAYRDVLVLYSLARDLWQHGDGGTGTHVDVLLPLLDDPTPTMSIPAYPSAREMNDLALPATDRGLDLDSVDVEGDTGLGLLTSFEMTGFDAEHDRDGALKDLDPPSAVHASLDGLSLAPVAPVKSKPAPHDWREGESPDSEAPTKR